MTSQDEAKKNVGSDILMIGSDYMKKEINDTIKKHGIEPSIVLLLKRKAVAVHGEVEKFDLMEHAAMAFRFIGAKAGRTAEIDESPMVAGEDRHIAAFNDVRSLAPESVVMISRGEDKVYIVYQDAEKAGLACILNIALAALRTKKDKEACSGFAKRFTDGDCGLVFIHAVHKVHGWGMSFGNCSVDAAKSLCSVATQLYDEGIDPTKKGFLLAHESNNEPISVPINIDTKAETSNRFNESIGMIPEDVSVMCFFLDGGSIGIMSNDPRKEVFYHELLMIISGLTDNDVKHMTPDE